MWVQTAGVRGETEAWSGGAGLPRLAASGTEWDGQTAPHEGGKGLAAWQLTGRDERSPRPCPGALTACQPRR